MLYTTADQGAAMDEHARLVTRVGDWLADGWDWDGIGAALGMSADEAYQRFGADAAEYVRRQEGREPGDDI
jgi:hypothetical protein